MTHIKLQNHGLCIVLFVISISIVGCGEGRGVTTLEANITSDPTGGELKQTARAEFSVNREFEDKSGLLQSSPSPDDVTVRVEWVWEARDGSQTDVVQTNRLNISDGEKKFFTARHSAPPDKVLVNFYYLRLQWNDDEGRHTVESQKALFTVPDESNMSRKYQVDQIAK